MKAIKIIFRILTSPFMLGIILMGAIRMWVSALIYGATFEVNDERQDDAPQ